MRRLILAALAVGLFACSGDGIVAPPPAKSPPVTVEANISESGDTLSYILRWGHAASTSSYLVTVVASGTPVGTATSGLPSAQSVTDTTIKFTAINLTFDSLSFTATVFADRGALQDSTPATVTWHYVKRPGVPGPIIVDSTASPVILFAGLDVHAGHFGDENFYLRPVPGAPLYQGGERVAITVCSYFKFSDGTVAMRTQDARYCLYNYRVAYAAAIRSVCTSQPPLRNPDGSLLQMDFHCGSLANARVQAWADKQCVDFSSSDATAVTVDTPSCPTAGTEVVAVPGGTGALVTGTLRGTKFAATIKLGWG